MKGEFPLAKGLLGHLDTVELRVVKAKLVIERDLLLEYLVAVGQNLRDGALVLGPESLNSQSSHVIENPDAKGLARHSRLGRVVDDRLAVLDGNDPGVRKRAVVCVGDELAEAEVAKQNSRVAPPEDDVAVTERSLAPILPVGHHRGHKNLGHLALRRP